MPPGVGEGSRGAVKPAERPSRNEKADFEQKVTRLTKVGPDGTCGILPGIEALPTCILAIQETTTRPNKSRSESESEYEPEPREQGGPRVVGWCS
jgi:hypothetical protein